MTTFDVTFPNVARPQVRPLEEQPVLEVTVPVALPLPASGQLIGVHIGTVRFGLERDDALTFFKNGLEEAEKLPESSKIEVATSMDGIDQAAQKIERLK